MAEEKAQEIKVFISNRDSTCDECGEHLGEAIISEHACLKYSGRVGRSAAAKELDDAAVRLAVAAHVRHVETEYDTLLAKGWDRRDARDRVRPDVDRILMKWQGKS